ncbi:MAG TPA: hypothetical protein VND64_08630 [Pirellulales bacterium]|nr:hypothetical protein [Pirellulales bacterium]
MILRLSQKLSTKCKVTPLKVLPPDPNPFADWSANLFTADRTQFIIVTNTPSLYSTVFYGRGIADEGQFVGRVMEALREFLAADGQEFIFRRFIAPASGTVQFSKALNRSVTGSMKDLAYHAKFWLSEGELSPHDTSLRLNEIPFSPLKYLKPREVFKSLAVVD